LANEYGITTRTLNNRLKKANLYIPDGIIFPKYLRKIYNTFGIPSRKADSIANSDSASDSASSGKDQPITYLPLPFFAPPTICPSRPPQMGRSRKRCSQYLPTGEG
jgi:hypothetical protein